MLFGISIVGATGIDTSTLIMGSYNDEEAAIKQDLLARAGLRVVIADSTKFSRYSFQITSKFAKLHPSSIDPIITESAPDMDRIVPFTADRCDGTLSDSDRLREFLPVPVLLASELKELAEKEILDLMSQRAAQKKAGK